MPLRLALALLLLVLGPIDAAMGAPRKAARNKDALTLAQELAKTEFAGKGADTVSDGAFVLAVIEAKFARTLTPALQQAITVEHGWSAAETNQLVEAGTDLRLKGATYALTHLWQQGMRVKPGDVRPGDVIQYWEKNDDGNWESHAGVVSTVEGDRVRVFGPRRDVPEIGERPEWLNVTDPSRRVAMVRLVTVHELRRETARERKPNRPPKERRPRNAPAD